MTHTVQRPRNGFGIAALSLAIGGAVFALMPITGFIAVIAGVLAFMFALIGHARYRRHEATNNKTCVTAAVLSLFTTALGIWGVVLFFNTVEDFSNEVDKLEEDFNNSWGAPESTAFDAAPVSPEPSQYTPTPEDYTVDLKVTSQQCFGSAGCNVTVEPELTYTADTPAPDMSCDVTYKISGDESGPVIETATVEGVDVWVTPSALSTSSASVETTAEVTDVTCY